MKVLRCREITNTEPTAKDSVLLVTFREGGKVARLRRDLVEFYPGVVCLPDWLDDKIFNEGGK